MTNRPRGVFLFLWPLCSCYSPNDTIATGPGGVEGPSSGSSGEPTADATGADTDTSASASSTSPGPDTTAGTEDTGSSGSDDSSGDASSSSASTTSVDVPVCGDGVVDDGEVCDDGVNDGSYGGCMPECATLAPHCGDEVLQPVEDCDDGDDENADGCNVDCVVSGSELWTESYSAAGSYVLDANAVATGPDDDVYVAGSIDTGSGIEAWIRRLDFDGNAIWVENYADNYGQQTTGAGLDVDGSGVAYVGGLAISAAGPGGRDGWIRAYDADAGLLFSHASDIEIADVGVSEDGNAAFVATHWLAAVSGYLLTRRFSAVGAELWTDLLDDLSLGYPQAQAIAMDTEENLLVLANYLPLDGDPPATVWLRKYDANGGVVWTRILDEDLDGVYAVATGPNNEVVIAGDSVGTWLRLYDQDGDEQWTVDGPNQQATEYRAVTIDDDGNVIAAGVEQNVGTVRKLSSIGAELWSTTIPDFSPTDVAVDSQQNILVSGNGDGDGWVRKLAP